MQEQTAAPEEYPSDEEIAAEMERELAGHDALQEPESAPEAEADDEAPEASEAPEDQPAPQESAEDRARRLGWRPKEEWSGDTTNWVGAEDFIERVENTPAFIGKLERKMRGIEEERDRDRKKLEGFSKIMEARVKDAVADAERRMQAARENFDFSAYDDAAKDKAQAEAAAEQFEKPEPQQPQQFADEDQQIIEAWKAERPWFGGDPMLSRVAAQASGEAAKAGASVAQQLAHADRVVREMFPSKFAQKAQTAPKPAPRPIAPAVEGGELQQPRGGKRETGWDDLPAVDRQHLQDMIEGGVFKDRTEALAEHRQTLKGL